MNSEDNKNMEELNSGTDTNEDDLDFPLDIVEPSCTNISQAEDEYIYEILTTEEIMQHMIDCIQEVNNIIELPVTVTRILLHHFKWDKEKLMEALFDGDQEQIFRDAKVINPFTKLSANNPDASAQLQEKAEAKDSDQKKMDVENKPQSEAMEWASVPKPATNTTEEHKKCHKTEMCGICFMYFPLTLMTGLECSHRFCVHCWREYLHTKIMEEGVGQSIECAAHDCRILVDDATVMRLIKDSKVRLKYQHLITNSFVECNRLLRWCSSPDCTYAVKVLCVDSRAVTCRCGYKFCFACGQSWHEPVRCQLLKQWIKKCDDDSETANWIATNTKECPKCHATIEKDGGCNHMVCKNQNCKADFCWVCLGPWEPHGSSWYNCNRFEEEEAKAARDAQQRSRSALERYLFYCNRYMNHMQSLKFEHKLYASVKIKMEEMQQHNMSWIEVQFLSKAVDVLCQCRQTLMYTYVFAYYLKKTNQSAIFEDNQRDLERATEILSEYLERDITKENLVDIKQKVQDKLRYCNGRRNALLEHVHEGYEKDWWAYAELI